MEDKLELNAVVELFGHQKVAGVVTEQQVAGSSFVRVDIPETDTQPSFSRFFNPSAIYAINPVTEEVMFQMAKMIQNKPIESWDIKEMNKKLLSTGQESESES